MNFHSNYGGPAWTELKDTHLNNNGCHNISCAIESDSCSSEMSDIFNICMWHRARMGSIQTISCGCGLLLNAVNSDSIGRRITINYYNTEFAVIDCTGAYCCSECQNSDTYTTMCGNIKVCPNNIHMHNQTSLVPFESDSNGNVPILVSGICGIKKGSGFVVPVAHSRGNVNVKSYLDAMTLHSWYITDGDNEMARIWFIVASHMPDRPDYIHPIMSDDIIYP